MSIIIDCAGKMVLRIKNATFYSLHNGVMTVVKEEQQQLSPRMEKLLEAMDQDIWGGGAINVDLADYLETKEEAMLFAYLVKKGIEKEHTAEYPFSEGALKLFWDFHKAILEYAQGLKDAE